MNVVDGVIVHVELVDGVLVELRRTQFTIPNNLRERIRECLSNYKFTKEGNTSPAVGSSAPRMRFIRVDLPVPLGPTMPILLFGPMFNSKSYNMWCLRTVL